MKILLVDDHSVVRQGYASLLRGLLPEVEVSEAASGEQAPATGAGQHPQPGGDGPLAAGHQRPGDHPPAAPAPAAAARAVLQHARRAALVRQALDAGAAGYITKNSAPEVLVEAVRRILAGHAYIEQPLATQLACHPAHQAGDPRLSA